MIILVHEDVKVNQYVGRSRVQDNILTLLKGLCHFVHETTPNVLILILCLVLFQVEEADQVYLLMKEEYRISRNVRLAWFLGKLNQVIWPVPKSELVG